MKALYDSVSRSFSKELTKSYSTSFSAGILLFDKEIRQPIYSIYGFVRLADEIVDSFHGFDQTSLFYRFKEDTQLAIDQRISTNPILNAFQEVYHNYNLKIEWVNAFLQSMELDLQPLDYNKDLYEKYIYGSAEVVGLMCLQVFCDGQDAKVKVLEPYAKKLGSAFQKINFLRDLSADYETLDRTYFPNVNFEDFTVQDKTLIENDILKDFEEAYIGIMQLPRSSRMGVLMAYRYYLQLLKKIKNTEPHKLKMARIRVSNVKKLELAIRQFVKYRMMQVSSI